MPKLDFVSIKPPTGPYIYDVPTKLPVFLCIRLFCTVLYFLRRKEDEMMLT